MWSKLKNRLTRKHLLLMLSGCAFILLTTPAWPAGMAAAVAMCLGWCAAVLIVFDTETLTAKMPARGGCSPGFQKCLAVAMVLAAGLGCNFWNNWRDSSYFARCGALVGLSGENLALIGAAAVGLAALPAMSLVLYWLWERAAADWRASFGRERGCRIRAPWALVILTAVYILGISAILKSNMYYQDDAGRGFYGYKQWDYFGRYLSTALATLVHGGDYLADIAPLPQLLAMFILAAASVLMLYILLERTRFSAWEVLAVVPLGLNPWFLECVSFRFDAPYMAVSVLLPVLPLLWRSRRSVIYIFAAMLGTLGACCSYQSATGVFPVLVIAVALRMFASGSSFRETLWFCVKSAAGFLAGMAYYLLVLMVPADAGYVSNSLTGSPVDTAVKNLSQYISLAVTDLKPWWLLLAALTAVAAVAGILRITRQKKLATLGITLAGLGLMCLLCFGAYAFLPNTLFRPRAMYGAGVLLAVISVMAAEGARFQLRQLPALVLSWVFLVFALSYGNILCLQREYTDMRMEVLLTDLQDQEPFRGEEPVEIYIEGDIGYTPVLENMPEEPRILYRLVVPTFAGGGDLARFRFLCYQGLPNVDLTASLYQQTPEEVRTAPVTADSVYHTIRTRDNQIFVELKSFSGE